MSTRTRLRLPRTRRPLLALIGLLVLVIAGYIASAVSDDNSSGGKNSGDSGRTIAVSALPAQARTTIALIKAGGPYPYSQDGGVFGNNERLLPKERRGYYHEYTVPTPGESDRGARRIITGAAGEFYYTGDHYASFRRIAPDP